MTSIYDAIVIGTGQSGPPLAARLSSAGMKVAVIEQGKFGGTLTRLSVERLDAVGGKQAFRPAMTVTQWSATKPRVVTP